MNKGFYITANFDINVNDINLEKSFAFRDKVDLEKFPDVLKIYEKIETETCSYYVNKLGGVIAFQLIAEDITEEKALEIYTKYAEDEDLYEYYPKLLKNIENTFKKKIIPNAISNTTIDLFEKKVKWDYTRIKSTEIQYYIECAFIFQLSKSLHLNLLNTKPNFETTSDFEILFNQSKNIFSLENPRIFLINENDIRKYNEYYSAWDLSMIIKDLKERYKLTIINYNHYNNIKDNNRVLSINIFVVAITTFTLINLLPFLHTIWPCAINIKSLTIYISIISALLLTYIVYTPILQIIKTRSKSLTKDGIKKMINKNKI